MKNSKEWPNVRNARIEVTDGCLYLCFQDGNIARRKFLGDAPESWPKDSFPAGKKRYGKHRAENHPEVEYHRPAKWKNRRGDKIPVSE
jgi:hypothetical protein